METQTRQITGHEVNGCNASITITADEPGSGGASHHYLIKWPNSCFAPPDAEINSVNEAHVAFQDGPIAEVGTNGITHEVLLTIVADRLKQFQSGAYACRENALALTKIEEAMHWLHHRTANRVVRGVEGTHSV